jgi:predicted N-acetyltransferase YhbS
MPDMLVNLLKLPPADAVIDDLAKTGVVIRRAQPFEITRVMEMVEGEFSVAWADEISVGFSNKPVTVFIATFEGQVVGFAGYECTRRSFFGPTGVIEEMQSRGIGKALLLACLDGLRELGYVYAIIGRAGSVQFYESTVGAIAIPDSDPGIYTDLLQS